MNKDYPVEQYIPPVMAYFSCNKDMARTIIRASKQNGEFESIVHICNKFDNKQERGGKNGQ